MKRFLLTLTLIATAQVFAANSFAQTETTPNAVPTDNYDDSESVAPDAPNTSEDIYKNEADTLLENKLDKNKKNDEVGEVPAAPPAAAIKSISELDKLTPFNDIAVIQKRALPKSQRFELNPNFGLITNNAFFMTTYLQARAAYSFTEKWALEATFAFFMDNKYKVTKTLQSEANVATASLLLPKMYYGADVRWSPIYGKMGAFSQGIIPFDMYFSAGGGVMDTNQTESPFAMHAGTGQIYGINKGMAFRWDLSLYFYSSSVANANNIGSSSQSFTDVQLSLGMSFFFPDATYR
jgi:outer membrane beta-barrel protein